jgi:hypothetical protein
MEIKPTRIYFRATYYSQNLEKHAKPNANHAFRKLYTNKNNIKSVRKQLNSLGILVNEPGYYELPTIMLSIYDEKLLDKSKELNKEYYSEISKMKNGPYLLQTLNNIKVSDVECYCQEGRAYNKPMFEKILGKTAPYEDDIMCFGSCKHTIFAAAKRQLKAAPIPDPNIANEFIEFCKKRIEYDIGDELNNFGYSYADWYNHLTKPKQDDMDEIVTLLNPYKFDDIEPERRKHLLRNAYEGICKMELQHSDGKPRMVCSIPPLTKFTMGPVTWQLEEICQEKLRGYCGGMNLTQMADKLNNYIRQGYTKIVEGDGSAFDNTQDVTLKEVDRYIYRRIADKVYHVPRKYFDEISQSYYKVMDIKYRKPNQPKLTTMMTYRVLGTVFSGDCDTTLCNTIRMAMYNIFINEKEGLIYDRDFVVLSKGDDFSVLYKPYVTNEFIRTVYDKYFLKPSPSPDIVDARQYGLGQVCKFLDIGGPESFKFCSLRSWYKNESEIILTRDPAKLFDLGKYARKTKTYSNAELYMYLLDQAIALKQSYSGIDIFDIVAKAFVQEAEIVRSTFTKKDELHYKRLTNAIQKAPTINQILYKPESRKHTDIEDPIHELNEMVLDISHRHKQYNIYGTYWETMKRIEKVNTYKFTDSELTLINKQINTEFDLDLLRSMLALK